jgi:hypothetical protein
MRLGGRARMRRGSGHERKKLGTRGMSLLIYPDIPSQFQLNADCLQRCLTAVRYRCGQL